MKNNLKILALGLFIAALSGCAGAPVKTGLPTYNLHGTTYVSLVSLCDLRGINFEYDTFTRTINLTKGGKRINMQVGEKMYLVNGLPQHLRSHVDVHQGAIVVPLKFKEQVIDTLFIPPSTAVKTQPPVLKIKKVVIDAGHGGNDPGAVGKSGLREKDVNLDIAKRLAQLLKQEGIEVVLTRSVDKFVTLPSRVDIANQSGADLFISIHSNANRVRSLKGFEVYYVAPSVSDSQRALTAAAKGNLRLANSCFASSSSNLKTILWDMIFTYNRAEAISLSKDICKETGSNLDVKILGIKGARFYVLKGVRMPGILIEVGFVSNSTEERFLKNYYYRQKLAESIRDGVLHYAQRITLAEAPHQHGNESREE